MADTGLALTLRQPWASAIVVGPKRVENRSWCPPERIIGERIWVHAGLTFDRSRHEVLERWVRSLSNPSAYVAAERALPRGAIIGSARVTGYGYSEGGFGRLAGAATAAIFSDPWWMGPFGWLLDDVRALAEPVPCRGLQKLWRVPADVLERCRAQEGARA